MPIKPDIFLLIILSGGLCIIIIGMVIAINCSLSCLSCSSCCQKIGGLFRRLFGKRSKRREKSWSKCSILNFPESHKSYGLSLVEGRPQGHGFYTAGPSLSSTETTSTSVSTSTDILQKISLMTQMGLVGSEYYSAVMGSSSGAATALNSSNLAALSPNTYKPLSMYSNFISSSGEAGNTPDLDFPGDHNSSTALNSQLAHQIPHPTVCFNCKGIGFLPGTNSAAVLPLEQAGNAGTHNNFDESSSSSDSALSSSAEMDTDADADMIICM